MIESNEELVFIAIRLKQSLLKEEFSSQKLLKSESLPEEVSNYIDLSKSIIADLSYLLKAELSKPKTNLEELVNRIDGGKLAIKAIQERQAIAIQSALDNVKYSQEIKRVKGGLSKGGSHSEYEMFEPQILKVMHYYHSSKSGFGDKVTQQMAIDKISEFASRPANSTFNNWYKRFKESEGRTIFNQINI